MGNYTKYFYSNGVVCLFSRFFKYVTYGLSKDIAVELGSQRERDLREKVVEAGDVVLVEVVFKTGKMESPTMKPRSLLTNKTRLI